MHCVFMGIPHSGKSTLIQQLLGKRPSIVSASTGVTERVVRVEIRKSTVHVSGLYWCELEDIDEEALTLMHNVTNTAAVHFEEKNVDNEERKDNQRKAFSLSDFFQKIFTWTPKVAHHKPPASSTHSLQSVEGQSMKPVQGLFREEEIQTKGTDW